MKLFLSTLFVLTYMAINAQCTVTINQKGVDPPTVVIPKTASYQEIKAIKKRSTQRRHDYQTTISLIWIKDTMETPLIKGQVILADSTDLCDRIGEMVNTFELSEIYMEMGYQGMDVFTGIVGTQGQLIDFRHERRVAAKLEWLGDGFVKGLYIPLQNAKVVAKDKTFWTLALLVRVKMM